jgi:hypothetical protein
MIAGSGILLKRTGKMLGGNQERVGAGSVFRVRDGSRWKAIPQPAATGRDTDLSPEMRERCPGLPFADLHLFPAQAELLQALDGDRVVLVHRLFLPHFSCLSKLTP